MMRDLDRANALTGARVIWSQWDGYLTEGAGAMLKLDCELVVFRLSRFIPPDMPARQI